MSTFRISAVLPRRPVLNREGAAPAAAAIGASAASGYLIGTGDWISAFALLAAMACIAIGMLAPAAFLSGLLVIRPLLDSFSEDQISIADVVSVNAASIVGILALTVLVGAIGRDGLRLRPPGAGAFLAVMVLSAFAAMLAAVELSPEIGERPLAELVRIGAIFAVFLLAANFVTDVSAVQRLFTLVALSAVVPAFVGIYQLVSGDIPTIPDLALVRIPGTFTGPNAYGAYLAVTGLILIGIPGRDLRLPLRVGALLPVLIALVGTYSRTGWALFLLGLFALEFRRRRVLVVGTIVAVIALALAVPNVRERIEPAASTPETTASNPVNATSYETYQWRLDTWAYVWDKYQENPVVGFGLKSTPIVNPRKLQVPGLIDPEAYDVHNSVLKLLLEGGPLLLAAYVLLIAVIVRRLYRLSRERWPLAAYARIVLVLWGALIVVGLFADDPLAATATMYALFALTGAVFGAYLAGGRRTPGDELPPDVNTAPDARGSGDLPRRSGA